MTKDNYNKSSYRTRLLLALILSSTAIVLIFIVQQLLNKKLLLSIDLAKNIDDKIILIENSKAQLQLIQTQIDQFNNSQDKLQNSELIKVYLNQFLKDQNEYKKVDSLGHESTEDLANDLRLNLIGFDASIDTKVYSEKRQTFLQLSHELNEEYNQKALLLRKELKIAYSTIQKEKHKPFLISLALLILLVCILSFVFFQLYVRLKVFLNGMSQFTKIAKSGELSNRLVITENDELGEVENEFNSMVDALERSKNELERSNKDLSEFAQMVSHDLQAPLRYISAYSQKLNDKNNPLTDIERSDFTNNVVLSTKRLSQLIKNLLNYSKVGASLGEKQLISFEEIVKPLISEFKLRNESIDIQIKSPLIEILVYPALIQTLLQNLFENSLKYNTNSNCVIQLHVEKGAFTNFIFIHDNGPGIPPKDQSKVFDLFARREEDSAKDGLGIGLAVCKKIAHIHGGEISIIPSEFGLKIKLEIKN